MGFVVRLAFNQSMVKVINVLLGMFLYGFLVFLAIVDVVDGKTECVWATGIIECRKNQTRYVFQSILFSSVSIYSVFRVLGSVVEIFDLDSPETGLFRNPLDPDDKVGFSLVDSKTGLWNVEGCASDQVRTE